MTKHLFAISLALTAYVMTSFAQTSAPAWPQLTKFHTFMSTTFHPAEDGDFKPLKSKADSLLLAASAWQASPIPANYKPAETKTALDKLVKQCSEIKKAVAANANDTALLEMITGAHNTFHTLVGECRKDD